MSINELAARTFNFLRRRKHSYQLTFDKKQPAVQEVLADLAKFCRANETTFHADPRIHAALEGRREVWCRITQHLNLSTEELYALYKGVPLTSTTEEDTNG